MTNPTVAYDLEFSAINQGVGWCFGAPPGLTAAQWPRSRVNGLPMAHLFTCTVPEEYRTKGPELVALALFQADDHVADEVAGVAEVLDGEAVPAATPFWQALQAYAAARHPQECYGEDEIGGGWVWIWLTSAEFGGPATVPPDAAVGVFPGYDSADGTSAYVSAQPAEYLALTARTNDPNVGKRPVGFYKNNPDAYIRLFSEQGQALGLDQLFFGKNHFGGTSSPSQGEPDVSPLYLEFDERLGGANLGGDGVAQLDLLSDKLVWACG